MGIDLAGEAAVGEEGVPMMTLHRPTPIIDHRRSLLHDRHPLDMDRHRRVGHGDQASGLEPEPALLQVMLLVIEVEIKLAGVYLVEFLRVQIQEDGSVGETTTQGREVHGQAQVLHIPRVGMKARVSGRLAVGDLVSIWML